MQVGEMKLRHQLRPGTLQGLRTDGKGSYSLERETAGSTCFPGLSVKRKIFEE